MIRMILSWLGWVPILGVLALLSLLPVCIIRKMSCFLGYRLYKFNFKRTRIARRNIHLALTQYNQQDQEALLKENHVEFIFSIFGMFVSFIRPKYFSTLVDVSGLDILAKHKKNALLVTVHMHAPYTFVRAIFTHPELKDAVVSAISHAPHSSVLSFVCRKMTVKEKIHGYQPRIVYFHKDIIRVVRNFIRHAGTMITFLDQDMGKKNSIMVPFFSQKKAATTVRVLKLASINKSSIIFAVGYWLDGRYKMQIHPPLKDFPKEYGEQDATRMNILFEEMIMQHPESYLWFHKRFKTCAEGESYKYQDI